MSTRDEKKLAKEAQEKGLHPDDVRKIVELYKTFREQDGEQEAVANRKMKKEQER